MRPMEPMVHLKLSRANGDLIRVIEEFSSNGLDVLWPCRTPQQRLAVWPNLHSLRFQAPFSPWTFSFPRP